MKGRDGKIERIASEATRWVVRRDRGLSAEEQSEFERWFRADPRHATEVDAIHALWTALERPAATGRAETLRGELRALEARDRGRWRAAGIAGALAASVAIMIALEWPRDRRAPAMTTAGEARVTAPRQQILPDGSFVEFSPGTEIAVAFNPDSRRVILRSGEAHFSVVKNADAPFIVEAGAVKVRAVGTVFAVQYGRGEIEVLVTEGSVSVSATPPDPRGSVSNEAGQPDPAPDAPVVEAGKRAVVPLGAPAPVVRPLSALELKDRLAWRVSRLDFSEATVGDAVRMFNRYNDATLRTGDDRVAAMRFTGLFRADNVEGFVRALEATLGIEVERRVDGTIVLRASP